MSINNMYETLACPSCNAVISENEKICPYCWRHIVLRNNDAFYYKDDKDENDIWAFIGNAISELHGKKPFLCNRATIEKCIVYLEKAKKISSDGIIDYFRSYLEYDYFERKNLNRKPGYKYFYEKSFEEGIKKEDIEKLEILLNNKIEIGR